MSYTQQQSPLHFPLSSPPLHIPPSLETLDAPTSKGYTFGVRRSSDGRKSVDETHASVESWRVGMASRSFKFDDKVERRPSLRLSNHRRTSSLFSLDLPHLSRTNSASTCSSHGTPPYSSWDPEVRVVSEEDEEDAFAQEPVKRSVVQPPTTVKRPGLTRRDTPIPPRDLEQPIRKPSKGFTSSLTAPTSPSVVAPSTIITPRPTRITSSSTSARQRPPLVRRDTPHPAFDPSLASRMPNFFSSSLRASLQRTSTTSPRDVTPYAPRMVPLTGFSPESVASDSFDEEEVVALPVVTRGRTMARGRFRSVVDDKLWIAV